MNVLVVVFIVKIVFASGIVAAIFFLGKLLIDAYRLRLVKRHIKKSKECVTMLLSRNLSVVYVNDYDKIIFPFLKEEILKSSLWDKLTLDYAVHFNKGYQDSILQKRSVTLRYTMDQDNELHQFELVFVPVFHSYVVCYISLRFDKRMDEAD